MITWSYMTKKSSEKSYQQRWHEENRDKMRAYSKKHYSKNRETLLEKNKAHYARNKDSYARRSRRAHLRRKYGITIETYDEMLKAQNGQCAICAKPFTQKLLELPCVDHCHETLRVRGLLCRMCNVKLKPLEDVEFYEKAIEYLTKVVK